MGSQNLRLSPEALPPGRAISKERQDDWDGEGPRMSGEPPCARQACQKAKRRVGVYEYSACCCSWAASAQKRCYPKRRCTCRLSITLIVKTPPPPLLPHPTTSLSLSLSLPPSLPPALPLSPPPPLRRGLTPQLCITHLHQDIQFKKYRRRRCQGTPLGTPFAFSQISTHAGVDHGG